MHRNVGTLGRGSGQGRSGEAEESWGNELNSPIIKK